MIVGFIKRAFRYRFFLARLTKVPPLGHIFDKLYFEKDEIYYLPKESVLEVNREMSEPGSLVLPSQVLERLVDEAEHHFLMNYCICRRSNECKDYPMELGCLFLGEATTTIDSRFGRQVNKEEALEHLKKCREAGLVHLVGRNKLDSAWLSARPDDRLLTICNCCPCCCLWMMLPKMREDLSSKVQRMPGVEISVNADCTGCGFCVDSCFVDAIVINEKKAAIGPQCRGCARCVDICPENAIDVKLPDKQAVKEMEGHIREIVKI